MKKIGVFGGTFNPVHKGHEITAIEFYNKFDLDKLLIIPANIPPHKKNTEHENIPPQSRFEMCGICFEKYDGYNIEVSDAEIKKAGVSYSFDTVKALRGIYPGGNNIIYFLVGSDMFLYIEQWHKYRELLGMCVFVAAFRNDADGDINAVLKLRDDLQSRGHKIELLENSGAVLEISSTALREKIKRGDPDLRRYLDAGVLDYIKERKIYV
jgi:nicotinate-nucleotide adenylyltransferase